MVLQSGREPLIIHDVSKHPIASQLPPTQQLGIKNFLGVPIILKNGEIFGNICAIGTQPFTYSNEHVTLIQSLANFLAYVIDLELSIYLDQLTGLYNRGYLTESFPNLMEESNDIHVLFLDVDNFKKVNDTFGHTTGDQLLIEIAVRLKASVHQLGIVARVGGDEFVILAPNLSVLQVNTLARQILNDLSSSFHIADFEFALQASMGISSFPKDDDHLEALITNADNAMYQVKNEGKNNYVFFNPIRNTTSSLLTIESQLKKALNNKELVLYYQPQVNIFSEKVIGLEALIRWIHPEKGLLLPGEFLPQAEECNLMDDIGFWVLENACFQNKKWQEELEECVPIAVNISVSQMKKLDFLKKIKTILRDLSIEPSYIALEITENIEIDDMEEIIGLLNQLRRIGISIALDDFGTGYSSLSYLKQLPINSVKIDRSFIKNILNEPKDISIVKSIVTIANDFDLDLVVEGIENQNQLNLVKELGCQMIQGYFISKPLPAEIIEQLYFSNNQVI